LESIDDVKGKKCILETLIGSVNFYDPTDNFKDPEDAHHNEDFHE